MISSRKIDALRADVGRLADAGNGKQLMIGFTKRELKRRDVHPLVEGQSTFEAMCGSKFWMAQRTWFKVSGKPRHI